MKDKFLCLLLCGSLAACNFTEECVYYGTLQITVGERGKKQMLLFPGIDGAQQGVITQETHSDTIVQKLLVGSYDTGVFMAQDYTANIVSLKGDVLFETADSLLETNDDITAIVKAPKPIKCVTANDVLITHADTAKVNIPLRYLSQRLELRFIVEGIKNGKPSKIAGKLQGISTGRYLFSAEVSERSAEYFFSADRVRADRFVAELSFAGVHRKASNHLLLTLTFEDGQTNVCTIDLTERLKSFHTENAVLTLDMATGEYDNPVISIADWKEENWGEIAFFDHPQIHF